MSQVELKITGRVQGVFYRVSTRDTARQIGLVGFVKNDSDGGVSVVAKGPKEKLNELVEWCNQGPPGAQVKNVDVKWVESGDIDDSSSFSEFEIRA